MITSKWKMKKGSIYHQQKNSTWQKQKRMVAKY